MQICNTIKLSITVTPLGLDQLSGGPILRCHFPTLRCTGKGQRGQLLANSSKGKTQSCSCPSWIQTGQLGAVGQSVPVLGCLYSQRNLRRVLFKEVSHLLNQTMKTRSIFQAYHLKKVTSFSHAHQAEVSYIHLQFCFLLVAITTNYKCLICACISTEISKNQCICHKRTKALFSLICRHASCTVLRFLCSHTRK